MECQCLGHALTKATLKNRPEQTIDSGLYVASSKAWLKAMSTYRLYRRLIKLLSPDIGKRGDKATETVKNITDISHKIIIDINVFMVSVK